MSPLTAMKDYQDEFALFGAITASYLLVTGAWGLVKKLWVYYLSRGIGWNEDLKRYGPWALVTGATDGIGRAYADAFARKGINVVLVSRNQEKLKSAAAEIGSVYGVSTRFVVADFSNQNPEIYDRIKQEIAGLEIGILVNNVGMSYDHPEFLMDIPDGRKKILDLIAINVTSCALMTHLIIGDMAERKRGLVINVSSAAADRPTPLLTLYSACKVFVQYLSQALETEYGSRGIVVQCVKPGFVATKLSGIKRPSWSAPKPSTYVQSALATIGKESTTYGYFAHWLQMGLPKSLVPAWIVDKVSFNVLSSTRARALRRAAEQKRNQ